MFCIRRKWRENGIGWGSTDCGFCTFTQSCFGLSGVSASLCVAVDVKGHMVTSTNPTSEAAAWQIANLDTSVGCSYEGYCYGLTGVSCASVSLCVAVDAVGNGSLRPTRPAAASA